MEHGELFLPIRSDICNLHSAENAGKEEKTMQIYYTESCMYYFEKAMYTKTEIGVLSEELISSAEKNLNQKKLDRYPFRSNDLFTWLKTADESAIICMTTAQEMETGCDTADEFIFKFGESEPLYSTVGNHWVKADPEKISHVTVKEGEWSERWAVKM